MNNTDKTVTPGYGYRLLAIGEVLMRGDEFAKHANKFGPPDSKEEWKALQYDYGCKYNIETFRPMRRKIDVGDGYRLVLADEVVKEGDEYLMRGEVNWNECCSSVGGTVADGYTCSLVRRPKLKMKAKVKTEIELAREEIEAPKDTISTQKAELTNKDSVISTMTDDANVSKMVLSQCEVSIKLLRDNIDAMKRNASGNAVLVRADGFSLPMNILDAPWKVQTFGFGGMVVAFADSGKRDGFGRAIYKERV